jgi:signal transduction histidine kinase
MMRRPLFERFVSLDHCGGTGLGLPIARGIAEAHRGTLDYAEGAFVIRLPRH